MTLTVLQVLPELESGGVERGTVEVARALTSAGHKAIVISAGGKMVTELESAGATHVTYPVGRKTPLTFLYAWTIRNFLLNQHVDVIDVRSRLPAWVIFLALKLLPKEKRPVLITTVHGAYSVNRYSAIMTRGDHVVAVSDFIKQYILDNYRQVNQKKITVIPRGVSSKDYYRDYKPEKEWQEQWWAERGHLKNKFIITLPGRISELKGQEDFLHVIKKLIDKGHKVHGLIVGGVGNHKQALLDKLERQTVTLGLLEHISFLGDRADLKEIFTVSDVILSLSNKPESFGRTIIEAIALGKPVLAYDHGGAREILKKCFPSGRINVKDTEAMCNKIAALLEKPASKPAACPYTLEAMLDQTIQLYLNCIDK